MNTEAVLEYDNWKQGAIRREGIPSTTRFSRGVTKKKHIHGSQPAMPCHAMEKKKDQKHTTAGIR
jgi:hypothetical protein